MKKPSNKTPKYNLSTWMTDLTPTLDELKLHHLTLPSAHNAGMDKKGIDGIEEGWIACQNDTFSFQLAQGVRVFDLRLEAKVVSGSTVFYFNHGGRKSKRTLENLLEDCARFFRDDYASKKNEILILNFHQLTNFQEGSTNDYTYFLSRLKSAFSGIGGNPGILPRQASNLTLAQIRTQFAGCNIIIASNKFESQAAVWDDIPHYWVEKDIPTEQELDTYITANTVDSYKSRLWSLQAVRYEKRYGPLNISDYLNKKFQPYEQALINSNIINVDFVETSSIVNHCITANLYKAERLTDKEPPSKPEIISSSYIYPWNTYFVHFNESTDNYNVDHYAYTIDDREEQTIANESTQNKTLELYLAQDAVYELKVYAVDIAGNHSLPMLVPLNTSDQPTGPGQPTPPRIAITLRNGKYDCSVLFEPSEHNVDHHIAEVYASKDIVDGKPVGEPVLSKILSRWGTGTYFDNLPNYDAHEMVVYAVNSFDLASDYSIKRISAYTPGIIPPTPPSNLNTSYDPYTQQLTVTFVEGEAEVGIARHTLSIHTDHTQIYMPFGSGGVITVSRSLDYTLILYATDQDGNTSTSITRTGSTKESNNDIPDGIREQTVLREELKSGSTTWVGSNNIIQYRIHLYDTKDVEGGESGLDGKIIGEPLREAYYSGSELTYTFDNLTPLKNYHVFVWGINAYGTQGGRDYNRNYTFMHGDPSWDQEYPTVPSNLLGIYTTWSGYLSVLWNASSDNFGIDHYVLNINDTREFIVTGEGSSGHYSQFVKLEKNIDYFIDVYAVDINGNRSRTAWYEGDTSDKDTSQDLPTTPQIAEIFRAPDDSVYITWFYVRGAAYIRVEVQEINGDNKQMIVVPREHVSLRLWNIQPGINYTVTVYAMNSHLGSVVSLRRPFNV